MLKAGTKLKVRIRASRKGKLHEQQHDSSPPRTAGHTRTYQSRVTRCRRAGEVASPERFHWHGSPHGCPGRWHIQYVFHELHLGTKPLVWRRVSRAHPE